MLKCEIRADNTLHIEGYVNAVERDSKPVMVPSLGRCVEQVRAGVFGAALAENPDVELLENHDHSRKLGSTSDGVLTLSEDSIGLRASADISDPDMITKARTRQLKGWSFGFVTTSSEVENRADNIPRRVVTGMKLSEVSLIDGKYTPCYAGTLVEVRAVDDSAEMVEFRADEDIEIVDYSLGDEELRYNPYHDPSNGRFCSGGGSGGGVLMVEKGQKGKGVYVVPNEKFQNNADNDMYEMAKYSAAKSGAVYLEYTESDGETKRYAATDRPFSRNWADVDSIPPNAGGVYRKSFSQKQIDYTNMDTDALESMEKEQKQIVNNALWATNMKVSDSKMASKFKSMLDAETELNYISTALAFKKGKTKVFTRAFSPNESEPEEQRSLADEVIEDMDNSPENEAPAPDYSYYERAMQLLELRYNPYHDPSNGRFCSGGGGGGGGVLVVEKGQKGKGVYVFDRDIDSEYEEWQKSKSNLDKTISRLKNSGIEYNDVKTLDTPLTSDEIVAKISGGDMTKGSCASVAFAYIGNEAGYDVRHYRGGSSPEYFSKTMNLTEIAINCGGTVYKDKNAIKSTVDTLKLEVKEGKNYYLAVGQHAAIVRKNGGKYEYLELQSRNSENNGFKELNTKTLHDRFGAKRSRTRYGYKMDQTGIIIESSKLANNSDFKKMLGYINTSENAQMKGKSGNVK